MEKKPLSSKDCLTFAEIMKYFWEAICNDLNEVRAILSWTKEIRYNEKNFEKIAQGEPIIKVEIQLSMRT